MRVPVKFPAAFASRVASAAAAALFASMTPAQADLDADALRADMQALIDSYAAASDGVMQPQGGVTVTQTGDMVVLTAPAFIFKDGDRQVDVPASTLNLRETGPDRIAFAATLPSKVIGVMAPPAQDALTFTIGAHRVEGIYRPSLQTFEQVDIALETVGFATNDGSLEMGALKFNLDNVEGADGRWRSVSEFAIQALRIFGPDQQQMIAVGSIENNARIDGYDLPGYTQLSHRVSGGNPLHGAPKADAAATELALIDMVQRLPDLLNGASGAALFRIKELDVAAIQSPAFKLAGASLEVGAAPEGELYSVDMALKVDEPTVDPAMSPAPPSLTPRRLTADAGLRRLPISAIWQAISDPLQRDLRGDPSGAEELEMAPMMAMGMAAEAGSFAAIKSVEFEVGPARLAAKGVSPLVPGLPEPPLQIEAVIEGLEELIGEVQKLDPSVAEQAMPILVALRGLGKAESQDGAIVHTYLIEQNPAGEFLVNGVAPEAFGGRQ